MLQETNIEATKRFFLEGGIVKSTFSKMELSLVDWIKPYLHTIQTKDSLNLICKIAERKVQSLKEDNIHRVKSNIELKLFPGKQDSYLYLGEYVVKCLYIKEDCYSY